MAEVTSGAAELVVLGPGDGPPALLAEAGHGGRLRPGDHVALGEVDVVLARMLRRHGVELEPAPVLDVLVERRRPRRHGNGAERRFDRS